jgi:hypothetical protein
MITSNTSFEKISLDGCIAAFHKESLAGDEYEALEE